MPTRTVFTLFFLSSPVSRLLNYLLGDELLQYINSSVKWRLGGNRTPVQEPESYVLSITPRGQKTQKKVLTLGLRKA